MVLGWWRECQAPSPGAAPLPGAPAAALGSCQAGKPTALNNGVNPLLPGYPMPEQPGEFPGAAARPGRGLRFGVF